CLTHKISDRLPILPTQPRVSTIDVLLPASVHGRTQPPVNAHFCLTVRKLLHWIQQRMNSPLRESFVLESLAILRGLYAIDMVNIKEMIAVYEADRGIGSPVPIQSIEVDASRLPVDANTRRDALLERFACLSKANDQRGRHVGFLLL